MVDIGVLVSGNGTNLQAIMDAIGSGRLCARIKVVISDNPNAFAIERAKKKDIEVEFVTKGDYPKKEDYDRRLIEALKSRDVELVVMAGFMRILGSEFVKAFPMRIMNIHPSLLPSFPGLGVEKKAIEYGVRFSGCTVHFVDQGVDTGPIIIQAVVPIRENDTPESLRERIHKEEHRIYPEAIKLYGERRLTVKGRRVFIKDAEEEDKMLRNPKAGISEDE